MNISLNRKIVASKLDNRHFNTFKGIQMHDLKIFLKIKFLSKKRKRRKEKKRKANLDYNSLAKNFRKRSRFRFDHSSVEDIAKRNLYSNREIQSTMTTGEQQPTTRGKDKEYNARRERWPLFQWCVARIRFQIDG